MIINVGSNEDPVLCPANATDPSHKGLITVAIEPDLHTIGRMLKRPDNAEAHSKGQLFILPCVVSNSTSIAGFRRFNFGGLSSSLAEPSRNWKFKGRQDLGIAESSMVPVLPMRTVLDMVPPTSYVNFLKTDMQGFDFLALSGVGDLLRDRVLYLRHESNYGGFYGRSYKGCANDMFQDFEPFLRSLGFEPASPKHANDLESLRRQHKRLLERGKALGVCDTMKGGICTGNIYEADGYWVNVNLQQKVGWTPWETMLDEIDSAQPSAGIYKSIYDDSQRRNKDYTANRCSACSKYGCLK